MYRTEHVGDEPPLTLSERARLRGLEREVRELRLICGFRTELRKACPDTDTEAGVAAESAPSSRNCEALSTDAGVLADRLVVATKRL